MGSLVVGALLNSKSPAEYHIVGALFFSGVSVFVGALVQNVTRTFKEVGVK